MPDSLTYVEFLSVFLAVPVAALAVAVARTTGESRRVLAGLLALVCIAVGYTAPWDSYLVGRGVWTYGEGVVAARFARVPLGEWLFFVLQTVATGLWYHLFAPVIDPALPGRDAPDDPESVAGPRARSASARTAGAAGWLAVAAGGAVLTVAAPRTYYLGMILLWAAPVLAFLWAVGGPVLWRERRVVAAAVAVPSLYLWVADRYAIRTGLWAIAPEYSTGLLALGLPIEEAVFFLLTNLLVVQGLLLFDWTVARAVERDALYALAGLVPGVSRRVPESVVRLAGSVAGRLPGVAEVRRRW
ncbi:lycopene cyclase domain-containing protein [Halorussus gelatinilyticus]|uniref:Lycopene cyclase domain-containing protein n=1 Tax=Halorussus gelatinilyticus TaxID=2937524 RepID=A0A8U0ICW0_9EURY|nr:lycopene cyclase domain-containing protein [Halorussus gelatinilyticus]UPV98879.1 lycopene cyclase domain-containing protein [Halorussus gelatinilyticus]